MKARWWLPFGGGVGGLLVVVATGVGRTNSLEVGGAPVQFEAVGSARCSNRGCHGGVAPIGTIGSEFQTWITLDRHAHAAEVLGDDRSVRMQKLLKAEGQPINNPLCQSCHSDPHVAERPAEVATGVGCEACHGPASQWIDDHVSASWDDYTNEKKAQLGFRTMNTERSLAQTCTPCHVGEGLGRQVNHDLIAAGHPRLNFELAAFLDREPKHWNEADVAADRPVARTPARTWAVGQVESMRAAVDLLADRAEAQAAQPPTAPWPEFTEYACYSCHHSLRDLGTRYAGQDLPVGSLAWNTWMMGGLRGAASLAEPKTLEALLGLERLMGRVAPPAEEVAGLARKASAELDGWSTKIDADEPKAASALLAACLVQLRDDARAADRATSDWDAAAQLILAIGAAIRDRRAAGPTDVETARRLLDLETRRRALLDLLRFPTGADSPSAEREPAPSDALGLRASLFALLKDTADFIHAP